MGAIGPTITTGPVKAIGIMSTKGRALMWYTGKILAQNIPQVHLSPPVSTTTPINIYSTGITYISGIKTCLITTCPTCTLGARTTSGPN